MQPPMRFFSEKQVMEFENVLRQNNSGTFMRFLRQSLLLGAAALLLSLGLLIFIGADELYITAIPVAALPAPLLANYFIQIYSFEMRKRRIEALVPDVLLQASVFPGGHSMEKAIEFIAGSGYGALSEEFAKASGEIGKGASFREAMESMKKRNHSKVLDRALELLMQGYESGADMGSTFREAASDLFESNSILRERNSTLVIEKYTLLFAGGIIVPVVLGLISGLVAGFDFSALAELGIGAGEAERAGLLEAAMFANAAYIAEYSLLASLFVANQEGNLKKSLVYAALLIPLGQAAYYLAQMLWI